MKQARMSKDTTCKAFVQVCGAQQNNLKNINVDIPRDCFVVFTGVSGSGKSSLAFGTIYAEAQRRYFDSIAPYARRLIDQLPSPKVREIHGLPPAVALEQRRVEGTNRSTVGTLTKISNSLRMLFSRAGAYPHGSKKLDSDAFSPNTHSGACPKCHGVGVVHTVTEESLVPDPSLSIRQKAVAAWPGAWQGKNYQDILAVLGYDIDRPWKELSKKDREWILFTEEKPVVTVQAVREAHRIQRPYQGTYMSAASYVLHTYATTNSDSLRKRVLQFMNTSSCQICQGKKLNQMALTIKFAGYDIAELSTMPLSEVSAIFSAEQSKYPEPATDEKIEVMKLITGDVIDKINLLKELGLDYLALDRNAPTLSSGELQRLRLATQIRSGLFGVVYILDEPSAGLHAADTEPLLKMLKGLKDVGNSLFIVEHDMNLVRQADWVVDMGPGAGDEGGGLVYSGPVQGIAAIEESVTRTYLFNENHRQKRKIRQALQSIRLKGATRNNLKNLDAEFPIGVLTLITGVSGAGKTTLVSKVLAECISSNLGMAKKNSHSTGVFEEDEDAGADNAICASIEGMEPIKRLVHVDQKPIGRTPRSNLATYTGIFDSIRQAFAATEEARSRKFNAGRFSFNVNGGRCTACEGEGFVSIELLFLPSVYSACSACHGSRYNQETLQIKYNGLSISQVLDLTVNSACDFFKDLPAVFRALAILREVGLGYLRLGQPATELSGGEAQRIKLAAELQRIQHGSTLYLLDEPTTGLHPDDTKKLLALLQGLVDEGNTVIVIEHDLDVIAEADWIIDLGPGAGNNGGRVVACGTPEKIAGNANSITGKYLAAKISGRNLSCPSS